MEYANGNELFNYIVSKKRLSEQEACEFFQQIISGIEYLHKFKIVHRDIKPENIILDNKKIIKIIDFGLSNCYKKIEFLSTQCGSPCYAAPEMISGNKYKGENIDVWSAGITLFAMVCGFLPFEDTNNDVLYRKITEGKFTIPQFLSDGVKDLLRHILTVDPEKRFKILDIKSHPWFGIVNPPKYFEGLMINYHIMPIEEKIIEKMSDLEFKPEEVRLSILANKHSHISTTYYLLLKREITNGLESIADMQSSYYKEYINNPKNLLHNYNNDINIIIRERCYKPPNFNEDIRFIPINYNYNLSSVKIPSSDDDKHKKSVTINNIIEIIKSNNEKSIEYLVKQEEEKLNHKSYRNPKEKFIKIDNKLLNEDESKNCDKANESDSLIVEKPITKPTNLSNNSVFNKLGVFNKNHKKKSPSQVRPKKIEPKVEEINDKILISDRHLDVSIKPINAVKTHETIVDNNYLLRKIYPKSGIIPDENTKVRGKPYNFRTNFIDTSMSFENNVDITKNNESSEASKSRLDCNPIVDRNVNKIPNNFHSTKTRNESGFIIKEKSHDIVKSSSNNFKLGEHSFLENKTQTNNLANTNLSSTNKSKNTTNNKKEFNSKYLMKVSKPSGLSISTHNFNKKLASTIIKFKKKISKTKAEITEIKSNLNTICDENISNTKIVTKTSTKNTKSYSTNKLIKFSSELLNQYNTINSKLEKGNSEIELTKNANKSISHSSKKLVNTSKY